MGGRVLAEGRWSGSRRIGESHTNSSDELPHSTESGWRHFVVEVVNDTTGGGDYFIEGIVRDFDGNPIPGATVWAIDYEGYYYYSYYH